MNELIIALVAGLASGLVFMAKSFFSEKGKNLATKQDIGKITTLIEDVKHQNAKEVEQMRAALQLANNRQNEYHQDVKRALIEYFETYMYWFEIQMSENLLEITEDNFEQFKGLSREIEKTHHKLLMSQYKIAFHLYDEYLNELISELNFKGYNIMLKADSLLSEVFQHFKNAKELYSDGEEKKAREEIVKAEELEKVFSSEIEPLANEIYEMMEKFVVKSRSILYNEFPTTSNSPPHNVSASVSP